METDVQKLVVCEALIQFYNSLGANLIRLFITAFISKITRARSSNGQTTFIFSGRLFAPFVQSLCRESHSFNQPLYELFNNPRNEFIYSVIAFLKLPSIKCTMIEHTTAITSVEALKAVFLLNYKINILIYLIFYCLESIIKSSITSPRITNIGCNNTKW